MLAAVRSAVLEGVDGRVVTVEVHVSRGLPGYTVVGLPDASGRESRERVRAALLSSHLAYPQTRVTVNLAPASVRKSGAGLELAIALGLLVAADELPAGALDDVAVLGELGLDGRVRPVVGALGLVDALTRTGVSTVIVPATNAHEAVLVPGAVVRVARTLGELHACLKGEIPWPDVPEPPARSLDPCDTDEPLDLADVRGLEFPREGVLESLRQPLEERLVRVSRAAGTLTFPADFVLLACANPCPCGRAADHCRCNDAQRARYARRLSAPLLDRFDIRLEIRAAGTEPGESSDETAMRVRAAVARQRARLRNTSWRRNAHVPAGALEAYAALTGDAHASWHAWCETRRLTGRGAARIRRVARTVADLADHAEVAVADVDRAVFLREDLW